ncbi:hypothetical protein N8I77_005948 [Diaporthe amygdali]|uniref:Uncharacterized protein n=1 Tax=Phomopsis amygdali TaxID=1214568 RepID=A0AAD9SFI6_PHOAM|nr:hypothetical protein N8I77_005948 [Diaporthe amygdali]
MPDWSGIMYRQSCTDPDWKDPSCPQYCLQKDQLEVGVWIQSCSLQDKKACCVTDAPSASCCNDTSNLFTFTPGYIQAVINGDGTNRLGPYVAADQKSASTTTTPAGSEANSSIDASASTTAAATAGDTDALPTSVRNAIIAVGAILGIILLISLVSLVFVWRKYSQERRLRREDREMTRRQQKENWPHHPYQGTFQGDGTGVAGARREMYVGEPKDAWSQRIHELPSSHKVGELDA